MTDRVPIRWAWLALVVTMLEITGCTTYFTVRQPSLGEFAQVITPTAIAWFACMVAFLGADMVQASRRARRWAAEEAARDAAFDRLQALPQVGSNGISEADGDRPK